MKAIKLTTVPFTPERLREAADLAEQIEKLTGRYNALITGGIVVGTNPAPKVETKKRHFSPAVRNRIAAGQRASWAKRHAAKAAEVPSSAAPTQTPA